MTEQAYTMRRGEFVRVSHYHTPGSDGNPTVFVTDKHWGFSVRPGMVDAGLYEGELLFVELYYDGRVAGLRRAESESWIFRQSDEDLADEWEQLLAAGDAS